MPTVDEAVGGGVDAQNATLINEAAGPVASGSGHQFNNANFWGLDPEKVLRREAPKQELSAASLEWLEGRFVKPGHYQLAQSRLADSRFVLVSGAAGSGRRSSAKMLLHDLARGGVRVREIPADTSEEERAFLNPETVREGELLLLDFSADTEFRLLTLAMQPLEPFRDEVAKARGFLVVVLPAGADRILPTELFAQSVKLERPPGRTTLAEHLKADGVALPEGSLDGEELAEFVADATMDEIGRLCQHILRSRERGGGRFEDCLNRALRDLSKRDTAIEKLVSGKSESRRALILAAAFLEGAHADVVGDASERLLTQVGAADETVTLLGGSALSERMRESGIELTEAREVHFPEYSADAVVNYFWHSFQGLRPVLLEWVGGCLTSPLLTDADRARVVRRYSMVCRRTLHGADLCALAAWLLNTKHRPVRVGELAARILAEGLKEEPGAQVIRRKIYDLATTPSLDDDLAGVLVLVCSGVLSRTHPEQAMVRLRHLAGNARGEVGAAARNALVELTNDDRILLELLWRLASGKESDAVLFLRIADPERFFGRRRVIDDRAVQAQLTRAWASVVDRPRHFWEARACDWFSAHVQVSSAEALLDVLVGAASRADRLGRLFVVLRGWTADGDEDSAEQRQRTEQLVRKKIDEVQVQRTEESE